MPAPQYPLTLPASPGFTKVETTMSTATGYSESNFTGRQHVSPRSYHVQNFTVTLPPMLKNEALSWLVFMTTLNGQAGTFRMGPPTDNNEMTRDATVRLAAAAGTYDLNVTFATGFSGQIRPGQYIELGTGATSKLYMITAATNPIPVGQTNAGSSQLTLWPPLKTAQAVNNPVKFIDPKGVFMLATNDVSWNIDEVQKFGIQFAIREAIR